ncbi:Amine oxidase [Mycena kentingensis (nom. inval.)]|nr:Amine oxidase [Mycena kentingensis (nom. inval.)]
MSMHPLDPLTPQEIGLVCSAVRKHLASDTDVKAFKFMSCYLLPPPKRAVLAFLGIPLAPGEKAEAPVLITRKAEVDLVDLVGGRNFNIILSLEQAGWKVDTFEQLPEGVVRSDPRVQELAKDVGIASEEIRVDGWSIGWDDRFSTSRRLQQGLLFARLGPHENLYAHPLDFTVVPRRTVSHHRIPETKLPTLDTEPLAHSGRERLPPPRKPFDFLPDLIEATDKNFKQRDGLKPLSVVQPDGVSFKLTGQQIEWQNWSFHVGFHHREGIVLSTITYNDGGMLRPIFYRLSLSEMVVPYGAPEYPHARKFAFDSGEYGMGIMANELSLGCDCLGQIHYLPGAHVKHDGTAQIIQNCICIHEEDSGVLWKHTDYRPGGRSQTVRRRRLVVSMVCTLANYEYIHNFMFYQDGSIEFEIRLTGILQVYVAADGEQPPNGTLVAPNVNAQYHQHIFCVRVDPMVDGIKNTLVQQDITPSPFPTGSKENFAGNAFIATDTKILTETGLDFAPFGTERRWRIVNEGKQHYSTGKDVGYSLNVKSSTVQLMAAPDGWVGKRAAFATKPLWVCRDVEGSKGSRLWPAGKYVPQTREAPEDSIGEWVKQGKRVENEDILAYLCIGTTHIPRPEDWPVMPVEHVNVSFKPQNFNHLIIVPGHAIWQGFDPNLRTKASEWAFESFGANQDSDRLEVFVKHIVRAAQIAAEDDKSLVVFSGGQTQPASTTTEGESYLRLAIKMDLFPGNLRATSENFALDSFQNLLFSVARFFEVTRRYPTKITVVGFEIKRARFEQLHRAAIRWPQSRFGYIGIDAAGDNTLAQQGELENGFIPFTEDSYGCHDFLLSKRTRRNYAARYPPYELTNPRLAALLGWCPQKQTELFHDVLPWPVLHD